MRYRLPLCALAFLPAAAAAADFPDIRGDWIGTTHSIIAGHGGPHWPDSKGTWDKPALADRSITLRISNQEGRRFWGSTVINGEGNSAASATEKPLIGTFASNGADITMANADGSFAGNVSGTTLSYCYAQPGYKDENGVAVAACIDFTKK